MGEKRAFGKPLQVPGFARTSWEAAPAVCHPSDGSAGRVLMSNALPPPGDMSSAVPPPPAAPWHRWLRHLRQTLVALLGLLALLLLWVRMDPLALDAFKPAFAAWLASATGLDVQVERLTLGWGINPALTGVGVTATLPGQSLPVFHAAEVSVRLPVFELLGGRAGLELDLQQPAFELTRGENGHLALGPLSLGNGATSPLLSSDATVTDAAWGVSRVQVRQARLVFTDARWHRSGQPRRFVVEPLDLSVTTSPVGDWWLTLEGQVADVPQAMHLSGRLELQSAGGIQGDVHVEGVDSGFWSELLLPRETPLRLSSHMRLQARLAMDPGGHWSVGGTLQTAAASLSWQEQNPPLVLSQVSGTLSLAGDVGRPGVALEGHLRGQLPHAGPVELRAALERSDADSPWRWQVHSQELVPARLSQDLPLPGPLQGLEAPLRLQVRGTGLGEGGQWPGMTFEVGLGAGQWRWERLFRWPLPLHSLQAQGTLGPTPEAGLELALTSLSLLNEQGRIQGKARLWALDGPQPQLEVEAVAAGIDTAEARFYYPVSEMSPHLVTWLDQRLEAGEVTHAQLRIAGPLAGIPYGVQRFPDAATRPVFRVDARVSGAAIRFHPGVDPVRDLEADLVFENDGFRAQVLQGRFRDMNPLTGTVHIPDLFHNQMLHLSMRATAHPRSLWDGLVAAPALGWDRQIGLGGSQFDGQGSDLDFHLEMPLNHIVDATFRGHVGLANVTMHPPPPAWACRDFRISRASWISTTTT
ncbi:MAG: hypothetical protein H7831_00880 [Magnetococcus sp. WYHC-3]